MKTLGIVRGLRLFVVSISLIACTVHKAEAENPLTVEVRAAKSAEKYSFVFINNAPVSLVASEPAKTDSKILLALPIAFTTAEGKIIGVFVHDKEVDRSVNRKLGGALRVQNGRFEILDTGSGALLTKEYLNDAATNGDALLQQFLIVRKGKPCSFKDKGMAQRRGIGKLKDGKEVMVESKGAITLTKFASDLVGLGVQDLLYSDLGAWGQSWLREPKTGKIQNLANQKSVTENHTNWLLVSEPEN